MPRPDGEVDFRVTVPKYPLTWVIHGVSMSRNLGLGIQPSPIQVSRFQPIIDYNSFSHLLRESMRIFSKLWPWWGNFLIQKIIFFFCSMMPQGTCTLLWNVRNISFVENKWESEWLCLTTGLETSLLRWVLCLNSQGFEKSAFLDLLWILNFPKLCMIFLSMKGACYHGGLPRLWLCSRWRWRLRTVLRPQTTQWRSPDNCICKFSYKKSSLKNISVSISKCMMFAGIKVCILVLTVRARWI